MPVLTRLCVSLLILIVSAGTLSAASESAPLPPGTVITMQNWQQYKPFMHEGLQILFEGKYFWKFPADFQMEIGPTHGYPLPEVFRQNTEKYNHLVKIVTLPDGEHSLTGYVAGLPFPSPTEPLKGWKMLVNTWYSYLPHITCAPNNHVYLRDRYGNETTEVTGTVYRQFNFISDDGSPTTDPSGPDLYLAEYARVMEPEQSKYTTQLTLYYTDPTRAEDFFLFIPALRRTLRLSSAARCSPFVGTDWVQDDVKEEFNGGISRFDASYMGEINTLYLTQSDASIWTDIRSSYYNPLLFPKPVVGKWEVRPTYVLDVRRIPSQRKGYCYGKRMLYIDKQTWGESWTDLYDENLKLWKISCFQSIATPVENQGAQLYSGRYIVGIWDEQNDHMTGYITNPPMGADSECVNLNGINYTDTKMYSSVSGLSEILQ